MLSEITAHNPQLLQTLEHSWRAWQRHGSLCTMAIPFLGRGQAAACMKLCVEADLAILVLAGSRSVIPPLRKKQDFFRVAPE